MPIFEFKCLKCGEVIEAIAHHTVKSVKCDCGGKATKVISAPGGFGGLSTPGRKD